MIHLVSICELQDHSMRILKLAPHNRAEQIWRPWEEYKMMEYFAYATSDSYILLIVCILMQN